MITAVNSCRLEYWSVLKPECRSQEFFSFGDLTLACVIALRQDHNDWCILLQKRFHESRFASIAQGGNICDPSNNVGILKSLHKAPLILSLHSSRPRCVNEGYC